ncbi:hypothetical protein M758_UG005800 [Ceratodon purpureus]|nr:hypothetical protein M758_UG005800 [Ceratodon purpureus]
MVSSWGPKEAMCAAALVCSALAWSISSSVTYTRQDEEAILAAVKTAWAAARYLETP